MAKRTNPVAWGLAVVLAVLVLGGCGLLSFHYRLVILLPRDEWGFGRIDWFEGTVGEPQSEWRLIEHHYRLGVIALRWK